MSTLRFDPLDYNEDHKAALAARNAKLRELRKEGKQVRGWKLTGQLSPYYSFGEPDGRIRNIYYIKVQ